MGPVIRVLHVLRELHASGAETMLHTAADRWEANGVHSEILGIGEDLGPFAARLAEVGYRLHHLPFTGDPGFLRRYAGLVRSGEYDVVHVHLERASVYLSVVPRLLRVGTVRTVHNSFPFEAGLRLRRRLQRRLARGVGTRFVSISPTVEENERDRFANPTTLIGNWVDTDRFVPPTLRQREVARRALAIGDEHLAVVTVGNCRAMKNHLAMIEALAKLTDVPWVLLHLGWGRDEDAERQLAEELQIADRCRFLGQIDPLEALHAADLYVSPSLYEGLGLAPVEALSTGLPVVLTDVPGSRDLRGVSDRMGWSDTDAGSLATTLRSAIDRFTTRTDEATRSAQHAQVVARFSPEVGVTAYSRLYAEVARG